MGTNSFDPNSDADEEMEWILESRSYNESPNESFWEAPYSDNHTPTGLSQSYAPYLVGALFVKFWISRPIPKA